MDETTSGSTGSTRTASRATERAAKARLWQTLCDGVLRALRPRRRRPCSTSGPATATSSTTSGPPRRIAVDLNPDTAAVGRRGGRGPHAAAGAARRGDRARSRSTWPSPATSSSTSAGPTPCSKSWRRSARSLRPGGRLIVMQPNVRALGGAFWDFVDHTLPADREGDGRGAGRSRASRSSSAGPGSSPTRPRAGSRNGAWLVRLYLAVPAGPVAPRQADARRGPEAALSR